MPHPLGLEDVHDSDGVVDALARMRAAKPAITEAIVKLNDGVAGRGNTVVELRDLPAPGAPDERAALGGRVEAMAFEHPDVASPATSPSSRRTAGSSRSASAAWRSAAPACSCG